MYRFIDFLPWERLLRRIAPEDVQFRFFVQIGCDQSGAAFFIITAGRLEVRGGGV
jgi:hypothetical protein